MQKPVLTLQQNAVLEINKLIIEGRIKLGERLNEVELAELLSMSRGPIRESLKILYDQGLLIYKPRKGMYVTQLTREDIKEIYDIQISLEKSAIELGFENVNERHLKRLWEIVHEFEENAHFEKRAFLVELDSKFHREIINLPKYKRLTKAWESNNNLITLAFAKIFEFGTETEDNLVEKHTELVEAIEEKNLEKYIKALTIHYEEGKSRLLDVWK